MIRVGCAGWPLPRDPDSLFASSGTHLERYAAVFPASEINSTFHRAHRTATFARWAQSVPAGFRFSVKLPKAITHEARLVAEPRHESWFSREAVELLQLLEISRVAGQAAVPNALRLMDELENAVQGENLRFGRGYRTVPGNRRSHAAEPVPKPGKSEGDEWPRGKR